MSDPKVSIIILNWNGWKDTIECIESLYNINYHNYNIIIVDNYSTDESIEKIKNYVKGDMTVKSKFFDYNSKNKPLKFQEYYPKESLEDKKQIDDLKVDKKLILIKNEVNYGFAEGNNIGIKYALKNFNPNYILLLNNDTVVDKNFLGELVNIGESHKDIGITGPKIYYYNKPDTIWSAGAKVSWKFARGLNIGLNEKDKQQYEKEREVEFISGCAFLIKREIIDNIGLIDKKFFIYFEEIDWTLRASKVGYKSVYQPKSKIWHKVSRSSGGIRSEVGLYYITRNRWLFMYKWAKKTNFIFFVIYQILGVILLPILLSIYYKNRNLFLAYYRGFYDGIKIKKLL